MDILYYAESQISMHTESNLQAAACSTRADSASDSEVCCCARSSVEFPVVAKKQGVLFVAYGATSRHTSRAAGVAAELAAAL